MKTAATTAAQLQEQLDDIDDILHCTVMFPDHPLAAKVRPKLLSQRRALVRALARFA